VSSYWSIEQGQFVPWPPENTFPPQTNYMGSITTGNLSQWYVYDVRKAVERVMNSQEIYVGDGSAFLDETIPGQACSGQLINPQRGFFVEPELVRLSDYGFVLPFQKTTIIE